MVGPSQPTKERQPERAEESPSSPPIPTSRSLIHDLTLPPIPNLNIPSSPPGSPDPAANAKFAHFLSLKKKGIHFNEKLAVSVSLKNPSLLGKLREHTGIDERAQYSTSLPSDVWDDVSTLPEWGYKEELLKTQQEERRRIEGKLRSSIEFVGSSISHGENGMMKTRAA